MIHRDEALAIQRAAFRDFLAFITSGHPDSRLLELGSISAAVIPVSGRRSITNSVIYDDAQELAASLDGLASTYDEAGVEAWTVWAPEFDDHTIRALEAAGHAFDGQPAAMVLELERFEPPPLGDLEWDREGSFAELATLNDAAYGHTREDGMGVAFEAAEPAPELRLYRAFHDGAVACALATIDHAGGDLGIYWVATDERSRGRGLATRLLTAALLEGRERGMRTSSLQASGLGEPVYAALGYRAHFRFQMWERRRESAGQAA